MDLNLLKDEIFAALKESASEYFDKEEDLNSLKEVAEEMAKLRLQMLVGDEAAKADAAANLKTWENIARMRVAQKVIKAGSGFEDVLIKILGVAAKVLAIV